MWIRTQNRYELIKTERRILVIGDYIYVDNEDGRLKIGKYTSGEELDNVMEMLQKAINNKENLFIMPKEGFSKEE